MVEISVVHNDIADRAAGGHLHRQPLIDSIGAENICSRVAVDCLLASVLRAERGVDRVKLSADALQRREFRKRWRRVWWLRRWRRHWWQPWRSRRR